MKRKVLFIDRDGTILVEPADDFQIDSYDKFAFIPGAISNLSRIARELDYEFVIVTNQDGLGTKFYPEESFWPTQNLMVDILKGEGVVFSEILIDRSMPDQKSPTRKPGTGMLQHYIKGEYDMSQSFVIGDRPTDVELAVNLGSQAIFFNEHIHVGAQLSTNSWDNVYKFLKKQPRKTVVHRKSSETDITIRLNLDGSGNMRIHTGLNFFDHMLEQLGKHGQFDLTIDCIGDLDVDEHHTIEDTAIALGNAFDLALGTKKGIERYGFLLPMDDSLAQVALDFGGRPWLEWEASFSREIIGDMPTEMFRHFFKSFCDAARCNLNIKVKGENEHHKIEAVFKAFAKCLHTATRNTGTGTLPSTKGTL